MLEDWQSFSDDDVSCDVVSIGRSAYGGDEGDITRGDRRGIATFHSGAPFEVEFTCIDAGACLCSLLDRCSVLPELLDIFADGRMDGWIDGWIDGWMVGLSDELERRKEEEEEKKEKEKIREDG